MCDYSIQATKTRDAVKGDKLVVSDFQNPNGPSTHSCRGFAPDGDWTTAVCLRPGTEVAFDAPVRVLHYHTFSAIPDTVIEETVATFRQFNKDVERVHHDALEFPGGRIEYIADLAPGQTARVVQLPAESAVPATPAEAKQERITDRIMRLVTPVLAK